VILPIVNNEPYFVTVKKSANIDTVVAARLAEIPLAEFEALNPSFNQGVILANMQQEIILPRDKLEVYNKNYSTFEGELTSWKTYPAKKGQTISSIASEFNVSQSNLRRANGLSNNMRRLPYDQAMIIPAPGSVLKSVAASSSTSKKPSSGKYRVRKGDTLSGIARKYNVGVKTLMASNNLKSSSLKIGQTIRIPN
jgi:membrane-bound lytic murein transglycosylase D